jgi:hypothetical protein
MCVFGFLYNFVLNIVILRIIERDAVTILQPYSYKYPLFL